MTTVHNSLPTDIFDAQAFQAQLTTDNPINCCKSVISTATNYLHAQFRDGARARDLIRQRAVFIDSVLAILWDQQDWGSSELALVAVGGYGRGELHPHSDVDILILQGEKSEGCQAQLESFLTLL